MLKSLSEIGRMFDTDKSESVGYLDNYEENIGHLRESSVKILEIGVLHGGSLLMWHEYFIKGLVVGLDLQPNPLLDMPEKIRFYQGSQDDDAFLDRVAKECAPEGFDIIIDDASHVGSVSRKSFRNLFTNHLKHSGVYVIEDWGTGYWNSWPDGAAYSRANENDFVQSRGNISLVGRVAKMFGLKCDLKNVDRPTDSNFATHNFGMVGFVKELIDEVGWDDVTCPGRGNSSLTRRASVIRKLSIYHGQVFLVKS